MDKRQLVEILSTGLIQAGADQGRRSGVDLGHTRADVQIEYLGIHAVFAVRCMRCAVWRCGGEVIQLHESTHP